MFKKVSRNFISKNYRENKVSITGSFEIKNNTMNSESIRSVITEFVGNFLNSLYNGLNRYEKIEKFLKSQFIQYRFTKKASQFKDSTLTDFFDK